MVLDVGLNLFGKSFFKLSPDDDDVLHFEGDRTIPKKTSVSTNTDFESPGTMEDDDTVGTKTWSNPDNAKASDNTYTVITPDFDDEWKDAEVKIVKSDDSIGTENKADTATIWPETDTYKSYGGDSDLWGETWTPADINNSNFGVVLSVEAVNKSHYLKATNFGFSIPSGATIKGILIEIERKKQPEGVGESSARVDYIQIKVYYTT